MMIFWTYAFPIVLGTFFYMAFSDIENNEKLDIINIAVVENDAFSESDVWKQSFQALSDPDSDERLFDTKYVSEDEAKKLLSEKEITGYFILSGGEPKVVVASDGINETVFKYVTEEIAQTEEVVQNVAEQKLQSAQPDQNMTVFYIQLYAEILEITQKEAQGIRDVSGENLSYTMIEFYTLIAMTCLYGGLLGMVAVNRNLANMSSKGKRVGVSPVSKLKLIFASVSAGYLTQLIGIVLLFVYTIFVLKVDYGSNFPLIVLLTLCGCLAGLSMGVAIAVLVKSGENTKTGIIVAATMTGCFLSGMMGITMKYIVDKNIPFLNRINPANMITDGFYALYYYDTSDRYLLNVVSLLIFALIMVAVSVSGLRRQKYDSI